MDPQDRLDHFKRIYLELIRMADFHVTIAFATAAELGDGTIGDCQIVPHRKSAHIRILDLDEPNPDSQPRDLERDIAHEVCHLLFWMVEPEDWSSLLGQLIEQSVETISLTLVAQRRALEEYE